MFRFILALIFILFLNGCTPGVGVGIPVGKIGYAGVGVNKYGVHPSFGVIVAPHVGVGVAL